MTTDTAVQTVDSNADLIEQVVIMGDLSKLTAQQRVAYYRLRCDSAGLDPLTRPFQYLMLNGRLVLYAGKEATDGVRANRGVSITKLERDQTDETYDVTAYAVDKTGRMDAALGSVSIKGLHGEALSNAKMKAETKAKRRVTLSISGLGMLDETEVASIPSAGRVDVDLATGEIIPPEQTEVKTLRQLAEAAADAAESPQDAPDAPEEGEVVPSADEAEPEALWPSAAEAPEDLTVEEFRLLATKAGLTQAAVKETAKRLYPEAKTSADLTDTQRGRLWVVLATEQGQ